MYWQRSDNLSRAHFARNERFQPYASVQLLGGVWAYTVATDGVLGDDTSKGKATTREAAEQAAVAWIRSRMADMMTPMQDVLDDTEPVEEESP